MSRLRVRALRCGVLRAPGAFFVAGFEGEIRLQVWAFLIEHPRGVVLFDSGMHPAVREDSAARLGERLAASFTIDYTPEDDVATRLERVEADPREIDTVVASHLHFDHAGGNALVPEARVIVQQAELDHARSEARGAYIPDDWETGQELVTIDGKHDLFGDGRVVCLPTFGHTPGHQSMLVRLDRDEVLLTADACYTRQSLEQRALTGFGWDIDRERTVLEAFATHEARGATLVFGHDPELSPAARSLVGADG